MDITSGSIGDKTSGPSRGYTTTQFSNEQDGHRGQLDKYCGLERGFFFCSGLLMCVTPWPLAARQTLILINLSLAYIISIILSVLRICDLNYTRNSKIQYLLDEREEILKLELKMQEHELRSQPHSPAPVSQPASAAPVMSRDEEGAILSSMTRPTAVPSSSNNDLMPSSSRFTGMGLPPIAETASSSSNVPHLSSADVHANLAMISDGSRYSPGNHMQPDSNQLPPYSPGNQRSMDGHGDESNEIRLSDYVKGETRAQDMKDGTTFQ